MLLEHFADDTHHFVSSVVIIVILIITIVALLFWALGKGDNVSQQRYLNALPLLKSTSIYKAKNANGNTHEDAEAHDTVFIVPDISHYTQFITGNHFSAARSQQIVFSLINAMIEASTDTFELSKFEGDAVLLFADARKHSPEKIGQKVIAIFDAFFEEKQQILEAGYCDCASCSHIENLDLKVFVHRGRAARFSFRGSVDHFGADVIILHRLMKNNVDGDRYVMITNAARESVNLSGRFSQQAIEEDLEHVGKIGAVVHKFEPALPKVVVS